MATLDDLRALGYDVNEPLGADVIAVRGFGVAVNFPRGEQAIIDALADAKAHANRKLQWRKQHSPRVDALGL